MAESFAKAVTAAPKSLREQHRQKGLGRRGSQTTSTFCAPPSRLVNSKSKAGQGGKKYLASQSPQQEEAIDKSSDQTKLIITSSAGDDIQQYGESAIYRKLKELMTGSPINTFSSRDHFPIPNLSQPPFRSACGQDCHPGARDSSSMRHAWSCCELMHALHRRRIHEPSSSWIAHCNWLPRSHP